MIEFRPALLDDAEAATEPLDAREAALFELDEKTL